MATTRKPRQATKSKIDTSKLKEFGSDYKSRGEQKLAFAKQVKTESEDVQSQIVEEQEKAQEKSLWSSIGGALGGLALGLATGGLGLTGLAAAGVAGIGAGLGTYGGAHAGKVISEGKSGKRKKIKSDMFYESEAEKQNLAFRDFDEKLNEGILNRSLAAGVMAAAFTGGGELIKKMKEGKAVKDAAKAAEAVKEARGAMQGYIGVGKDAVLSSPTSLTASLETAKEGAEFVMNTDISGIGKSGTDLAANIDLRGTEDALGFGGDLPMITEAVPKSELLEYAKRFKPTKGVDLALKRGSPQSQFITSSLTPLADEVGPSIMDSYLKGIAGQKSKSMQQSLLAAGGMSLYGYRPELDSLRQIQFGTNIKPYG